MGVNLDTCCHRRWHTASNSHLSVITFVSQPHDIITHTVYPEGKGCYGQQGEVEHDHQLYSHSNISVVIFVNLHWEPLRESPVSFVQTQRTE